MSVFRSLLAQKKHTELEYFSVNANTQFILPIAYNDSLGMKLKISKSNHNCNIINPSDASTNYLWDLYGNRITLHYNNALIISLYNAPQNCILESKKVNTSLQAYVKDFDGNILTQGSGTFKGFTFSQGVTLFGEPTWGGQYALVGDFYYLIISDNNEEIIHEYIPVIDKNKVVCIYDKIDNIYIYPNIGTPTAGPTKD